MIFSYDWLKDYVSKLPKPEKLAELLTLHFAEVEEAKKSGQDFILKIDIKPNRASDCFSHLGIAREAAAILSSKLQLPDTRGEVSAYRTCDFVSVAVKDKRACPRYTAKALHDVKVGPSPKWLSARLKACGLRPINNIVDATNYVMLETGQPLHAFDADKLSGRKILVRFAKKNEKIITLDGEEFNLDSDILVIADEEKPVAIAGIKGGKEPQIDKKTKNVVIESANFNSRVVRRGSRRINLRTDASLRFEHGLDPNLTEFAVDRTAFLIQKVAGGKIAKEPIDVYANKVMPSRVKLDFSYLNNLLGLVVPKAQAVRILKRLGFRILKQGSKFLLVEVPTFRLDVSLPEDLIEEIGRIAGYNKIPAVFPAASLAPAKRNDNVFWADKIKDILKEAGFSEVYNYSFLSEKDAKIFKYKSSDLIEVQNPLSMEQKYLRPSLIPGLLGNAKKNIKYFPQIKIFEVGNAFEKARASKEKKQLTCLSVGGNFYQLKGVVDFLFQGLGISRVWYDECQPTPEQTKISVWHPKKCAEIKKDVQEIGFLGEISPKILQLMEITEAVAIFEIDLEKLTKLASEEHEYSPISRFPSVVRDLAVLVPHKTKVAELLNKINAAGGKIIRDIDLFDIYEGEELPDGKKNLAFHIIYQAEDRTLTSKEIDEIQNKIMQSLEKEKGWEVRR